MDEFHLLASAQQLSVARQPQLSVFSFLKEKKWRVKRLGVVLLLSLSRAYPIDGQTGC
jgi:hypothetical protein